MAGTSQRHSGHESAVNRLVKVAPFLGRRPASITGEASTIVSRIVSGLDGDREDTHQETKALARRKEAWHDEE